MKTSRIFITLSLLLSMASSTYAQSHWTCDPYAYEYDMAIYFSLKFNDDHIGDMSGYELAAFNKEECRGVGEVQTVGTNESFGYVRIYSNSIEGDTIIFKVYDKNLMVEREVEDTLVFQNMELLGMPSSPKVITFTDGRPVTVTVKNCSRIYGAANPVFEYESEGYDLIGTPEITCEADINSPIGEYPIIINRGSVKNKKATFINGVLTITQAPGSISYSVGKVEKIWGDMAFINELTMVGDGTVTYSSDNAAVAAVNATTGEVTIKGAGVATITATVANAVNYMYATNTATYTLCVAPKALADIMIQPIDAVTYTGEEQKPAITVKDGETTLTEDIDYILAFSDNVNAGTATVTIKGKGNYDGTANASFTINKATGTINFFTAVVNKKYGDESFTNVLTKVGDGTVTYSSGDTDIADVNVTTGEVKIANAGTVVITATVTDGSNYMYAVKNVEYTINISKINIESYTAPVGLTLVYTGEYQTLIEPGIVEYGEMQYSLDNETWSIDVPKGKEIKDYIVYYRIVGDRNHNDIAVQSVMASIKGRPVYVPAGEFATFCSDRTLTLDKDDVAELYTVSSVSNGIVYLSEKLTIVPKGMPMLVYNPTVEDMTVVLLPSTEEGKTDYDSTHFYGTVEEISFTAEETEAFNYYVCNGLEFIKVEGAGILPANRAYLKLSKSDSQQASHLYIDFDDGNITGISTSLVDSEDVNREKWYDLNGRLLQGKPTQKGLYIKNGRKVVVK